MIRGIYSAGSGMLVNQKRHEGINQNIENLHTPGYQEISEGLASCPKARANIVNAPLATHMIGTLSAGVRVEGINYKSDPGLMRETGNYTDMALNGNGYFTVATRVGEHYTRNGHFVLDGENHLRTAGGNLVMGENGPIGPLPDNFQVQVDGTFIDGETQEVLARLRISHIPSGELVKEGETSLFKAQGVVVPVPRDDIDVVQGFVEESNVSLVGQMVKMMEVARSYQSNQKVVQIIDTLLQKTVTEIGRV